MSCRKGGRLDVRAGRTASTSLSNGRSWCARAVRATSRTRAMSCRKETPLGRRVRSTSVFTKNPTSPSSAPWARCATGVPTTRLRCPVCRYSSASKAASSAMNGVVPSVWQSACNEAISGAGRALRTTPTGPGAVERAPRAEGVRAPRRHALQRPAPVRELPLQHLALEPPALPHREVGVLHLQLSQRRRASGAPGAVEFRQIPEEDVQ